MLLSGFYFTREWSAASKPSGEGGDSLPEGVREGTYWAQAERAHRSWEPLLHTVGCWDTAVGEEAALRGLGEAQLLQGGWNVWVN